MSLSGQRALLAPSALGQRRLFGALPCAMPLVAGPEGGPCGRGHSGCGRPRPSSKAGHCCSISLVQSDRRATSDGRSEQGRALPPCAGWGRVPGAGARGGCQGAGPVAARGRPPCVQPSRECWPPSNFFSKRGDYQVQSFIWFSIYFFRINS